MLLLIIQICSRENAQSCLSLCGPMDCSLPATSVHGISQARITGVGCHFLLQDLRACSVLIVPPESTLFSQTFFYLSKKIANATSSGSFLSLTIPIKMNHSFFWVPIDSVFFKASGQNLLVDIEINST